MESQDKTKPRTEPTRQGTVTLSNEEDPLGEEEEVMSSDSYSNDRDQINEDKLLEESNAETNT